MVNDIKSKLPFKKKGNAETLDENEDESGLSGDATDPGINAADKTGATDIGDLDLDEEDNGKSQTLIDKIKSKLIPKKKVAEEDDTDLGEGKKPAKKKINPVVLVVVLAGLGLFLFYEEEPEQVAVPTPPRKSMRKTPKTDVAKVETPAASEAPAEKPEVADTATETPSDTTTSTDTPVIPDEAAPSESPADTTIPATDEPAVVAEDTTPAETPTETVTTSTEPVPESKPDEPSVTDTITPDAPVDLPPASTDSVDGQVADTDESSMTDKILEDLEKQVKKDQPKEVKKEYVMPPDYEYKGRGLVYNCAGKHWACVDGPSYKSCEDNFSSTTFKKKKIECYPFNVYNDTKGCELMQNRVVSSNAKTSFCNGN